MSGRFTPDQWLDLAVRATEEAQAAWEAKDADRFVKLSRHAAECEAWALLAEGGYVAEFPHPFNLKREMIDCHPFVNRFGRLSWVHKPTSTFWNPSTLKTPQARRDADRRKGFLMGTVRREAIIRLDSKGKAHRWPHPTPQAPVVVLDNGSRGTQYL